MSESQQSAWPRGAPAVGQRAERSRTIGARDIDLFTEISGDKNPLHYDEVAATALGIGGITSASAF